MEVRKRPPSPLAFLTGVEQSVGWGKLLGEFVRTSRFADVPLGCWETSDLLQPESLQI